MNTISLNQKVVSLITLAFIGLSIGIFAYVKAAFQSVEESLLPWMSIGHFGVITFCALLIYTKPRARAVPFLTFVLILMVAILLTNGK